MLDQTLTESFGGCKSLARLTLQALPERHAFSALMGKNKQVVVIIHQPAEGSAQDLGQCQIITGLKREPNEVQAILYPKIVE